MILIAAFAVIVVTIIAAPVQPVQPAVVVVKEFPSDNIGIDDYNFGYELSDGQARREFGQVKNPGSKDEILVVYGSFSHIDPITKELYFTTYTSDENGYHAMGSHIHV